jgi:cytochrome d ubiquinol oxidase subunit I
MHTTQVLAVAIGQQVVPARAQMGTTLGFHIILACFGIAFPTIVLVAEYRGLRRSDEVAMLLARRWSQVLGVLVAVGAVTGTVLSFEMGLLWPGLMRTYGAVLGVPFGFEGIFFFLEAIFTGIYLYGWQRLPGWMHFYTGIPIAITGLGGAVAVMAANSWMNSPGGFTLSHGKIVNVDPWQVFFNRASLYETPHMILAAYIVVGFMIAAVYAAGILRGHRDRYHRLGFGIPFTIGAILTPVQIVVGDTAARAIAAQQPVKFAAIEYVTRIGRDVPDSLRRLAAGRVQALHQGHRAELGRSGLPAARDHADPPVLRRHDRAGVPAAAGGTVGAVGVVAAPRPAPAGVVLVARDSLRAGRAGGDGVRLDRDRGRPPAVGRL